MNDITAIGLVTMMIIPAVKVAVASAAVLGTTIPVVMVSLLRRVSGSIGIAEPTAAMLRTENSATECPLFRHFPALADKLAWRSLGAVKTPIHTCRFPSSSGDSDSDSDGGAEPLEFLVKREDLISPLYGGNKVG
uniref:Uncharacterized protein n=1 Tax=Attheya septentrionalis TaxID=420275 RepID=A0A7S2U7U0_9STRA|mmetsp:Transcript_13572/g.24600  ORF Transcript_13572/g.24600 Transcript_13572/m.24600 type:complete len:135 (+) Transcript_13572:135-539(+)